VNSLASPALYVLVTLRNSTTCGLAFSPGRMTCSSTRPTPTSCGAAAWSVTFEGTLMAVNNEELARGLRSTQRRRALRPFNRERSLLRRLQWLRSENRLFQVLARMHQPSPGIVQQA